MNALTRVAFTAIAIAVLTASAHAYLLLGARVGDRTVAIRWNQQPIRYFITDRAAPGVSQTQFQEAVGRAARTWQDVPGADASFELVGFTGANPLEPDGMSTFGFLDRPQLERVLGATDIIIDTRTGAIVESDIFFNSSFPWSVAPGGEPDRHDLEAVALHEIGHLLGLGHSAIGETELLAGGGRRVIASGSVMFPIAFSVGITAGRTLRPDDIAAVSDVYPSGAVRNETGTISGRVTKNGQGIFGAHIVAFNPQTGSLVGGFSLTANGDFSIAGLTPGPHLLRVEPLDDGDLDSFFETTADVDVDFSAGFHDQYAIVPAGGSATGIVIEVRPR